MNFPGLGIRASVSVLAGLLSLGNLPPHFAREQPQAPEGYRLKQTISIPDGGGNLHDWRFSIWEQAPPVADFASLPAKLCAALGESTPKEAALCYEARTGKEIFTAEAEAQRFAIRDAPAYEAILFRARTSAGGSGWATLLTLLIPERGSNSWRDLLPEIVFSNQGEYRFLSQATFSSYRLLIVADAHGETGETHFAAHRYRIRTFAYCDDRGSYGLTDQYLTVNKYPSLDEVGKIQVIGPEQQTIERRLQNLKKTGRALGCSS